MNILLIEDEPMDMKLFSIVLRAGGHSVRELTSAEHALRAIKAHRPEVILADLKLPYLDGLTLIRQLKLDPDTRAIPVVAVTAAPEQFSRQAALAAGCDAYIVKPVDTRALAEQVEAVVQGGPESRGIKCAS